MEKVNAYARQDQHQEINEKYISREIYNKDMDAARGHIEWLEAERLGYMMRADTLLNLLKKIQQQQKDNQKAFELFVGD